MSEKYKFRDNEAIYFITPTIIGWVDLFTMQPYFDIVIDSLKYCQKHKALDIYAWCIMTSHLHLIIGSQQNKLSDIIRDFKVYTSKQIIEALKNGNNSRKEWILKIFQDAASELKRSVNYKVWQDGNHPIELCTNEMMDQRLDYLHENPVASGIVDEPEAYVYSSAKSYIDGSGLLEIKLIE
jgi:putative transposase